MRWIWSSSVYAFCHCFKLSRSAADMALRPLHSYIVALACRNHGLPVFRPGFPHKMLGVIQENESCTISLAKLALGKQVRAEDKVFDRGTFWELDLSLMTRHEHFVKCALYFQCAPVDGCRRVIKLR